MRLNDIHIDGFGIWKGLTVDTLSEGMTLFYGHNEAGKTTLMHFIRSMLFGFSAERRDRYIPPVYGGLAGGNLHVVTPQGNYVVERHVDPNRLNDMNGDLEVTDDASGTVHGKLQLATLLSDIDESIFNNVFAIGLREIQELNTLNSTDAAEHLYKLTTGLDRVSLVDVMRQLNQRLETIWTADQNQRSRLSELHQRRKALNREIDDLMARSRRWSKIALQTNEVTRRLEEIEEQLKALGRESKIVEVAMQIGDRWRSRSLIDEQIAALGTLPDGRDVSIKALDKLNQKIAHQREKLSQIKQNRKEIKRQALELPINRQLWSQAARVDAMIEHLPWIEALQRQVQRLHSDMNAIRQTLGGEVSGLGTKLDLKSRDVRELTNRGFTALQTAAKNLTDHHQSLEQSAEAVEVAKREVGQFHGRLKSAFAHQDEEIGTTREDAGRLVNRLRRRIELEEKIEKLNQSRHDLEKDIDDVVNEQVLPVGKLAIIGCVFILGIVFAGFGLLSLWWTGGSSGATAAEVGFLFMVLGAVFGIFSLALKHHWERVARDELDDFRHQFDLVRQQLKRAKTERDEIERHLPAGVGEWDLRLKDAEHELTRLEDLIPLESRLKTAQAQLDDAQAQHEKLQRQTEELSRKWRESLRLMGLPEDLSADQVKEITHRSERITGFHNRLEQYETEALDREKELDALTKRIDVLLQEVGLDDELGKDPTQRLEKLRLILGDQRRLMGQRKDLAAKFRNLRGAYERASRELDRLLAQKQRMMSAAGAESEEQYRDFAIKHQQLTKLTAERQNLTDQIAAALGPQITEQQIGHQLKHYGQSGLESRWTAIQSEIEEFRDNQTKLHQQRGEFLKEVKMLGEDARLDEARLERSAVEQEIANLKQQWRVLAVSSHMLEAIRENYEAKRQPETLREASLFLERLTEGNYTRIWTRLVGEELLVDNAEGETLTVQHLSRGTRETVYLGLRLALVSAYARRGAILPMVLDDVLVNFDANRARAAAAVLRDFADSGYQLLMFTCHDHIRDLFNDLAVDVRVLPHHKDVVGRNAVPVALNQSTVQAAPEPELADPLPIPDIMKRQPIDLPTEEYDAELQYELAAVGQDQQRARSLDQRSSPAPSDPKLAWPQIESKQKSA